MSTPTQTTQTATATKTAGGKKVAPVLRPFFVGTLDIETHTYQKTGTISAANTATLDTFNVRTNGWLDSLWIDINLTVPSANAAAVAYKEDSPANIIQTFTLSDSGGQPLLGPMSGWELAEFVKMGGFSFSDDYKNSQTYSAVTGTGATGGNVTLTLQVPVTFVRREPLGALPNTNNNTAFNVDITLNTSGNIYSTAPTALPNYTVQIWQDAFRQSAGKDPQGNAAVTDVPGKGSTLYLIRSYINGLSAGSVDEELPKQTGSYRALGFVLRDSTGSRAQGESDWPNPTRIHYNNDVPYDRLTRNWRRKMERQYGYVAAVETAGGRSNGAYWLPFMDDGQGMKAGSENRTRYWNISAADTLSFDGSIGGSGTHQLAVMFNFVVPPGGNIRALAAR